MGDKRSEVLVKEVTGMTEVIIRRTSKRSKIDQGFSYSD